MRGLLLVAIGSALGGSARFGVYQLAAALGVVEFPWGTLAVNVAGSFVIGWFGAATPVESIGARQFVMTGICGGFTTFSAFSLDTLGMLRNGEIAKAALNIGGQMALCLAAVWAGHAAGFRK